MEIVDFLRARYDEAADDAARGYLKAPEPKEFDGWDKSTTVGLPPIVAGTVLADIEAKRSVVDFADTYEGSFHASQFLPKMAAVYRDHPDFDPAWLDD